MSDTDPEPNDDAHDEDRDDDDHILAAARAVAQVSEATPEAERRAERRRVADDVDEVVQAMAAVDWDAVPGVSVDEALAWQGRVSHVRRRLLRRED